MPRASSSTPKSERILTAKIAAFEKWASETDRSAATKPARDGWLEKLADQIDPDHRLSAAERRRRAEYLRKAHMQRIALKSAQARRKKNRTS